MFAPPLLVVSVKLGEIGRLIIYLFQYTHFECVIIGTVPLVNCTANLHYLKMQKMYKNGFKNVKKTEINI